MAEESTDKIAQMLLSLRNGENLSTLQPPLRRGSNENFDQFSNSKPDVNLQLSLGGFYDNSTPNSAPAPCTSFANLDNSLLKKSLPEEVAEIKISNEIQVITKQKDEKNGSAETPENEKSNEVNPLVSLLGIPVWAAAQSSFANPAFQRALNAIKSRGIPSTPGSNNLRGYTSENPRSVEGYGSRFSTHYQPFMNRNPIRTPISNGMNQRFFMPQKQPENLNLVAPANSPCACQNLIPNQQFQMPKFAPHFNCSLATMNQPPQWSTDGSLTTRHSMPAPFAPSGSSSKISFPFPANFGIIGHNFPIVPQHATTTYNNPYNIPSNFFPNANVPPFLPISNSTSANVNPFMPYQPIRPFSGPAGARSIPLTDVINSSRVNQSPSNPPHYPCKRAKYDNPETGEAEQQLMKLQLPIVVTTGGNPNGKRLEGLLYKYGSEEEVKIICVCHGCFFTPEEFVRHAGGGANVENPRQQISVLDYSDFLMKE